MLVVSLLNCVIDSAAKINAREIFKAVCGKDAPTEVRFL